MKLPAFAAYYRNFRPGYIFQREYRHLFYFLIWPALGLRYVLLERVFIAQQYYDIACTLDALIPFQELFLIPYVIWYLFIFGIHVYTCLFDLATFKWYSRFMLLSFFLSTLIFLIFPTCQNLRPATFPRSNFLTGGVGFLYSIDTNTNVCPSEHVIGSIAALLTAFRTKGLQNVWFKLIFGVTAIFTSLATVFIKQHSIFDVFAALPVCIIAYRICSKKRDTP